MPFTPFAKQLYVATSPLLASISAGGATCFPTVLLHQLKANDTSIVLDFETASWMGSIHGLAGIPSIFIPSLMQWKGRKFAFITTCLITLIGWILAYTATSSTAILLYVAISPLLASISAGGAVCFPTVLLHQLKANDTSIVLDFETASWMGSIHGLAGIPSIFIPSLMQWKGRKFAFITTCLITLIGWILAYTATSSTAILVSESFHGLGTSSLLAVSCLLLTELTSPKHRDLFIQLLYIEETAGMASEGLLIQYFHWKTISLIMFTPMMISLLVACTLPESPYWLAYKGEFQKCEKNFIWLRGIDAISIKELTQMKNLANETNMFEDKSGEHFWEKLLSRNFYIPAAHVCLLQFLIHGSGTIVTLIYSIVMLENTTGNANISSFGGLIMNSMFCLGICVNIVLDRYFNKKPVLLWSIASAVVCLIVASAFSYSQSVGTWPKESLACLYCLSSFIFCSSLGIASLAYPVAAALIPVRYRGLGGGLLVITTCLFHVLALKSAPYLFLYLDMWGTFLVYSAISICCGLLIWKYVPETKERSLQDIENYYTYGKFRYNNETDVVEPMIAEPVVYDREMIFLGT